MNPLKKFKGFISRKAAKSAKKNKLCVFASLRDEKWLFLVCLLLAMTIAGAGCTMGEGMSRGSNTTLLSIAGEIHFSNADLGKSIQLRRNQKLLISLKSDPEVYGKWTISGANPQMLGLRSRFIRGESALNETWFYEAIGYGNCTITLTYTPYDDTIPPRVHKSPVFVSNIQ